MVRVQNTPPSLDEIRVMQEFYDRGFSVKQTGKEFGWSKQCLLKYIKVRRPVVSKEERKRRKVENVVNWKQRTKKEIGGV